VAASRLAPGVAGSPGPARRTYVRDPAEVLADVAAASSAAGDLQTLLDRLAALTMEVSDADRVSVFLIDHDTSVLRLWAASTQEPNEELWDVGRAMPGIPLDDVPDRRRLLEESEALGIPDASASPLVPPEWVRAFSLASLVAAPLHVGGKSLGLLVADYREPRELPVELVRTVGAIARSAALAVSHAWLSEVAAERAAGLESLLEATQSLSSPRPLSEVAEQVADAIVGVLGARHLSVHLLERRARYRTLVQRGVLLPAVGNLWSLSRRGLAKVLDAWSGEHQPPVVLTDVERLVHPSLDLPEELGPVLVLPLARPGADLFGFILVGLDPGATPTSSTLDLASALAAHVAFAIDRARLGEQVAVGVQFACALLALSELDQDEPEGLLASLRQAVPPAIGFEVVDVRLGGPGVPAARQLRHGSPFERELWRRWRPRRTRPPVVEHEGELHAPVWTSGQVVGVVRARMTRGGVAPQELDQLEALASALGDAVERDRLRREAERRDRELALAAERAEVAAQLHATVGRLLEVIEDTGGRLDRPGYADEVRAEARRVAALARAGRTGLEHTISSLEALAYDPRGLEATLAEVVARLGSDLEAAADVEVRGQPRALSLEVEQTLARIVYEALSRVGSSGRASAIAVRLEFGRGQVELIVRDDGVGLASREAGNGSPGVHFGLRLMQRRLENLGGRLEIERPGPRGLLLRATVPA
jgi:signal transduction histidine kinase